MINTIISISNKDWEVLFEASISFSLFMFLCYYLIRRNTHLINADDDVDVSLDDLEERLRLFVRKIRNDGLIHLP